MHGIFILSANPTSLPIFLFDAIVPHDVSHPDCMDDLHYALRDNYHDAQKYRFLSINEERHKICAVYSLNQQTPNSDLHMDFHFVVFRM